MSESLRRGLRVLTALADEPATATAVAAMTGASLSTALRLLQLLESEGFARRDDAGRYHLGTHLLKIAYQRVASMDIREVAAPVLRELNQQTGHTVHLGYFENRTVLYIDKYTGTAPVQMYSRIGLPAPLHCTAMGKVTAAYLPASERAALATDLDYTRFTERTITSAEAYIDELARVRQQGYAVNGGEHEDVISAVAAAIMQPDGRVQYGIDVAVPNILVSEDELRALAPRVVSAAATIQERLGY